MTSWNYKIKIINNVKYWCIYYRNSLLYKYTDFWKFSETWQNIFKKDETEEFDY